MADGGVPPLHHEGRSCLLVTRVGFSLSVESNQHAECREEEGSFIAGGSLVQRSVGRWLFNAHVWGGLHVHSAYEDLLCSRAIYCSLYSQQQQQFYSDVPGASLAPMVQFPSCDGDLVWKGVADYGDLRLCFLLVARQ
eukprot:Gb_29857 [translate_table: standard]